LLLRLLLHFCVHRRTIDGKAPEGVEGAAGEVEGRTAVVEERIEDGQDVVSDHLPNVTKVAEGLNTPAGGENEEKSGGGGAEKDEESKERRGVVAHGEGGRWQRGFDGGKIVV